MYDHNLESLPWLGGPLPEVTSRIQEEKKSYSRRDTKIDEGPLRGWRRLKSPPPKVGKGEKIPPENKDNQEEKLLQAKRTGAMIRRGLVVYPVQALFFQARLAWYTNRVSRQQMNPLPCLISLSAGSSKWKEHQQ